MLTVCTTSPDGQLATLQTVMDLLGATASSSGIDDALNDATAWVERYVTNSASGVLRRQVYQETLAGRGTQRLMLSRVPVLGVQRMFNGTATETATEYCSTNYRVENADAGFLEVTTDAGFQWDAPTDWFLAAHPRPASVYRPWLVVYEAGWQFGCSTTTSDWVTTTTGRTVPPDLSRAVALKAAELYQGVGPGLQSIKVGPLALSYGGGANSVSVDPVTDILSRYRSLE